VSFSSETPTPQGFSSSWRWARHRVRIRHVRHRRRVLDDAAADFRRHRARGRGRLGRQPHRRVFVFRRHILLAPPRHRSGAGAGAAEWRHIGTALGVWTFTLLRSLGQLDLLIALSYVILLTTVGGLMFWEGLRAILRARRGVAVPMRRSGSHGWIHGLPLKMRLPSAPRSICPVIRSLSSA